jgi:glutamine synthetase type III
MHFKFINRVDIKLIYVAIIAKLKLNKNNTQQFDINAIYTIYTIHTNVVNIIIQCIITLILGKIIYVNSM